MLVDRIAEKLSVFKSGTQVALDMEWEAAVSGKVQWPWSINTLTGLPNRLVACGIAGYIGDEIYSVAFPAFDETLPLISTFCINHKIGGHNLIADLTYLEFFGIDFVPAYDTMAERYLLHETEPRSLEVLATKYAKINPDFKHTDALVKVRPEVDDIEAWQKILNRVADDVYATVLVHDAQRKEINELIGTDYEQPLYEWEYKALKDSRRSQLLRLYSRVILPRIRLAARMNVAGSPIDKTAMDEALATQENKLIEVLDHIKSEFDDLNIAARMRLDGQLTAKEYESWSAPSELNHEQFQTFLNSPTRLKNALNVYLKINKSSIQLEDTSKEELSKFQNDYPLLAELREYRHIRNKVLGTYLRPWRAMPSVENDDTLHCSFGLWTETGRASASSETGGSLHQMPREAWMRRIICAPDGYKLIVCDNSMAELRAAAWLANERHMQELFNNNIDLHRATAGYISNALPNYKMPVHEYWNRLDEFLPLVTPDQRDKAKPVNFGLLYAQQPPGFIVYARTSYGIQFSLAEAVLAHRGFFELYPDMLDFFQQAYRWIAQGYAITPFGRIKHITRQTTHNEVVNFPIQSVAAEWLNLASITAEQELRAKKLDATIFAEIHDSMLATGSDADADEAGRIICWHMEHPRTDWLGVDLNTLPISLKADLKINKYWSK